MLAVSFLCLCTLCAMAAHERIGIALKEAGLLMKVVAKDLGVSEQRLYAFLRGESPMDVRRLDKLPQRFHQKLDDLNVAEHGGGVVLRDERIARLLNGVEMVMAKAEILLPEERKRA